MIVCRVPFALAALALSCAACKKPVVESYRVPKEAAAQPVPPADATHAGLARDGGAAATPGKSAGAAPAAGSGMAATAVPTASGAALTWQAPSHWKEKPASAMRKATFGVTADGLPGEGVLSITAFPGGVGGDLANLNRWRSQVSLPPVAAAELGANSQSLERNGLKMTVVDLSGKGPAGEPERILGAMVPHAGSTWFFKLTGPTAVLEKEKAAFMGFLDTLKPAAGAP